MVLTILKCDHLNKCYRNVFFYEALCVCFQNIMRHKIWPSFVDSELGYLWGERTKTNFSFTLDSNRVHTFGARNRIAFG